MLYFIGSRLSNIWIGDTMPLCFPSHELYSVHTMFLFGCSVNRVLYIHTYQTLTTYLLMRPHSVFDEITHTWHLLLALSYSNCIWWLMYVYSLWMERVDTDMTVIVSGRGARNLAVYGTAHDKLYSVERFRSARRWNRIGLYFIFTLFLHASFYRLSYILCRNCHIKVLPT